jgi:hypothetical protein
VSCVNLENWVSPLTWQNLPDIAQALIIDIATLVIELK